MQEGNKSLGMLKIAQFGREISTLSPVAYITVDFKKLVTIFAQGRDSSEPRFIVRSLETNEMRSYFTFT